MAVLVIERLETVDIDHQDPDRIARPAALGEQPDEFIEVASVREPGQWIGRRTCLGIAMRHGPRQGRRGRDGRAVEDPSCRLLPGRADPARDHDRADHRVPHRQRCRHDLAEAVGIADASGDPVGDLRRSCPATADVIVEVARRQRCGMGRDAGPEADQVGRQRPPGLIATHDDDMVDAGRAAQLLRDRIDDGVG